MKWKDTVSFKDLHPAMVMATIRIDQLINNMGYECWISSGNDSTHLPDSKHYKGEALDYRTHDMKFGEKYDLETRVQVMLGPQFFAQLEDVDGPNEHLHVQFNGQP